jgi:hypothetical protein
MTPPGSPVTQMKIYQHDNPDAFRFRLSGELQGAAVAELDRCWAAASSILKSRPVIVDLSGTAGLDDGGRRLLMRMRDSGVQFTAAAERTWDFRNFVPTPARRPAAPDSRRFWTALRGLVRTFHGHGAG